MAAAPAPDPESASARLDEVARRYYAPLLSFFRKRTRNAPEVQDLVQQVFLRLAQHPEISTVEKPDAYIFQAAANALTDHYRRAVTHDRLFAAAGSEAVETLESYTDLSPERVIQAQEAMVLVASALRELPERTRDIFMLRCFEGLKHAEVARLVGISVRAVEKHVAKALVHVSRAVEQGGAPCR